MPVRAPLLEARRVQKIYRGAGVHVRAVDGVDLVVERGELVAIMGPSGSGKTTMLNCLSGLDDIDGGQVLIHGRDLAESALSRGVCGVVHRTSGVATGT